MFGSGSLVKVLLLCGILFVKIVLHKPLFTLGCCQFRRGEFWEVVRVVDGICFRVEQIRDWLPVLITC